MSRDGKKNERRAPEIDITPDLTLAKVFAQAVHKYGEKVAMREKEFGIWRPITWNDYYERVKAIALGLVSMGLERGDKVALIVGRDGRAVRGRRRRLALSRIADDRSAIHR